MPFHVGGSAASFGSPCLSLYARTLYMRASDRKNTRARVFRPQKRLTAGRAAASSAKPRARKSREGLDHLLDLCFVSLQKAAHEPLRLGPRETGHLPEAGVRVDPRSRRGAKRPARPRRRGGPRASAGSPPRPELQPQPRGVIARALRRGQAAHVEDQGGEVVPGAPARSYPAVDAGVGPGALLGLAGEGGGYLRPLGLVRLRVQGARAIEAAELASRGSAGWGSASWG